MMRNVAILLVALAFTVFGEVACNTVPYQDKCFSEMQFMPLEPQAGVPECSLDKKLVFAHYVPWYVLYNNFVANNSCFDYSLNRDANLQASAKHEIALAQAAGIDGFFINLGNNPFEVINGSTLWEAAKGTSFLVGICLDFHGGDSSADIETYTNCIESYVKKVGSHPNYPRVDGKPVFATFASDRRKPESILKVREKLRARGIEIFLIMARDGNSLSKVTDTSDPYLECYDMSYLFQPSSLCWHDEGEPDGLHRKDFLRMKNAAATAGKGVVPTLALGYTGRRYSPNYSGGYIAPRGFDKLMDCYNAFKPGEANWLHVTSWNDFDETAVLPRSSDSGASLDILRELLVYDFKGVPRPPVAEPTVYFAALRESIPGAMLRIEALIPPDAQAREVTIFGELIDDNGYSVYAIPEQVVAANALQRREWVIPTADLAAAHVLIPRFTVRWIDGDGKEQSRTHDLPGVLLRTPWIQNPVTMRTCFNALTEVESELLVRQEGNLLFADLLISDCDEEVTRALLYRNDQIIGEFTNDYKGAALNFLVQPHYYRKNDADATRHIVFNLENCTGGTSFRRFGYVEDGTGMQAKYGDNTIEFPKYYTGHFYTQIFCKENAKINVTMDGIPSFSFTPEQLIRESVLLPTDKSARVEAINGKLGTALTHEPLKKQQPLHFRLYTQSVRSNDVFHVRFITKSGKNARSDMQAHFAKSRVICQNVLQTLMTNDSRMRQLGYLTKPDVSSAIMQELINPVAIRSALWNFNGGNLGLTNGDYDFASSYRARQCFRNENACGGDALGERGIQESRLKGLLRYEGADGSGCLVLAGKELSLPHNVMPYAAFTLAMKVYIPELPAKTQRIIRPAWYIGGFEVNIEPDGTLALHRLCFETVRSTSKIIPGQWNTIHVTFDENTGVIYLNGERVGEGKFTPMRDFRASKMILGDAANGFNGKIDDIFISGEVLTPDEAAPIIKR